MTATDPRNILAIKLADLGDLLLTEPALRSLRAAFPFAEIDLLTTPAAAPLAERFDGDYRCITFDKHIFDSGRSLLNPRASTLLAEIALRLRRGNYDTVCIFHHLTTPAGAVKFRALAAATGAPQVAGLDNGRGTFLTARAIDLGFGAQHEVDYMLDVARVAGGMHVDAVPRISPTGTPPATSLPGIRGPFAAIFPTTGPFAPGRNWFPDSLAVLARDLVGEGLQPVIMGASDASEIAGHILGSVPEAQDLTGQTNLDELIGVISHAAVVVTGDSFPGHLARAIDRPVVSIFGPSNHRAWKPYQATELTEPTEGHAIVVRQHVPCSPCLYTGYRLGRRNGCLSRTCLRMVTPDDVMSAVRAVIGVRR